MNQESAPGPGDLRRRLAVYREVVDELAQIQDQEEFCRKTILLGHRIGFSRLGLWLNAWAPAMLRGCFGTDEKGRLRDERARLVRFKHGPLEKAFPRHRRCRIVRDVPLRDQGVVVGRGEQMTAPLLNDKRVLGLLGVDNLLSKRPFSRDDEELLVLYADTVGHLYARLQADRRTEESEAKYALLVERAIDGITIVQDERFVFANASAAEMMGYAREDLLGRKLASVIPPECRKPVMARHRARYRGESPPNRYEVKILRRDGDVRDVEVSAGLVPFDGRQATLASFRDITERKQAESNLRESEARFRALFENSAGAILLADAATERILDCNRRAEELFGRTRQELVGMHRLKLHPPEAKEKYALQFRQHVKVGRSADFQGEVFGAKGRRIPVWIIAQRVSLAGRDLMIGVFVDVSDLRRAEQALRESEERYRDLVESAPLCVFEEDFTKDPPVIRRVNRQAELTYGWSAGEFLSLPVKRLVAPEAAADLARFGREIRAGRNISMESTNVRRDGSKFPVRLSATVSPTLGLQRTIVMIEDITERWRARQAAEEAQKTLAKAREQERQYLANELHDSLAQSLVALKIKLQRLRPGAGPEELKRPLEICDSLIQEVRQMAHRQYPPALESLGLPAALRRLAEDFQASIPVIVRCRGQAACRKLSSDAGIALFRMAQEALANAHRHSRAKRIDVLLRASPGRVTLQIADDGMGFDAEGSAGRGRGMATMRERVRAVGGECVIRSRRGQTIVQAAVPLDA